MTIPAPASLVGVTDVATPPATPATPVEPPATAPVVQPAAVASPAAKAVLKALEGLTKVADALQKEPGGDISGDLKQIAADLAPAERPAPKDLRDAAEVAKLAGPSFDEISQGVNDALRDKYKVTDETAWDARPYIVEVYSDAVVYDYDGKLWKAAYAFDAQTVKLSAEVQVRRTYEPIAAGDVKPDAKPDADQAGGMDMKKIALDVTGLDALVTRLETAVTAIGKAATPAPSVESPSNEVAVTKRLADEIAVLRAQVAKLQDTPPTPASRPVAEGGSGAIERERFPMNYNEPRPRA